MEEGEVVEPLHRQDTDHAPALMGHQDPVVGAAQSQEQLIMDLVEDTSLLGMVRSEARRELHFNKYAIFVKYLQIIQVNTQF